ncbi:MAG: ribbon-helix-helix protein, CopG family [Deltaproteobacteria bacterium]|nr:ribbon-helix-helix protein, CopG family [Deltaproteobacteria bacterium]
MGKTALATQITEELKEEVDAVCDERGTTISWLVEEALREKILDLKEEEALLQMSLKRLAEPGEKSFREYRRLMSRLK